MKTYIITAILVLGALLRPQSAPITDQGVAANGSAAVVSVNQIQAMPQALNAAEMNAVVGGGIADCYEMFDVNGDRYGVCCVDLWLFRICVSVNLSAIERLLPF